MSIIEDISAAIVPAIESTGNLLEEVTLTPDGSSKLLTIIVDNETPLNLDQVTVVTKAISEVIDSLELLGDRPFTLEVTTPGLDRPLTLPRHWKKNGGRLVKVTKSDGSTVTGRIGEISGESVFVDAQEIAFADISKAMIEVEFKKVGA
jgi:ribosome maturation factor RimP